MSQCTKCGTNFIGTPESPPLPGLCKYCEIELLKHQVTILRTALVAMVGASSEDELRAMRHIISIYPDKSAEDKAITQGAIDALLETMP